MEDNQIAFTDLTDDERAALEKAVGETEGAKVGVQVADFGATALVIIGTATALAALARISFDIINKLRGGQLIDLTGDIPVFKRDRDLDYGLVVLRLKDGEVKVEVHQPNDALKDLLAELTKIITELGKAGIEAAKAAVEKAAGTAATVTTTP
jgi:hypothetical protein